LTSFYLNKHKKPTKFLHKLKLDIPKKSNQKTTKKQPNSYQEQKTKEAAKLNKRDYRMSFLAFCSSELNPIVPTVANEFAEIKKQEREV
jgi:hypothetical protein